jgi:RNA polymerase sigma-70 factor, ECF subfamily
MQEIVLNPPGRTLEGSAEGRAEERAKDAAERKEFESRLPECAPLAFRVALGVLRNAADAEEVAQDALLRAFRKFRGLRDPARFRSWIVRVSFRLALDRWRSAKRRQVRETAWSQPVARGTTPSVDEIIQSNEFQARLERALSELPEKSRLVLILCAIQGHTLEEVAKLLGIPMGTVKSRLFFARKQLAEKLR